jgi:hypothetical protein
MGTCNSTSLSDHCEMVSSYLYTLVLPCSFLVPFMCSMFLSCGCVLCIVFPFFYSFIVFGVTVFVRVFVCPDMSWFNTGICLSDFLFAHILTPPPWPPPLKKLKVDNRSWAVKTSNLVKMIWQCNSPAKKLNFLLKILRKSVSVQPAQNPKKIGKCTTVHTMIHHELIWADEFSRENCRRRENKGHTKNNLSNEK